MTHPDRALPAVPDALPARHPMRLRLHESRVVAFARSACAEDPALGRMILSGCWDVAALAPLARVAVDLAIAAGELRPARRCALEYSYTLRLMTLLAAARPLPGARNSLAEYLGGRVAARLERLVLVARRR